MSKEEKWMTYAVMINGALNALFEEDSPNYVGDDFLEEVDLTQFLHALANAVPTAFYEKVTGKSVECLDFNHIANRLCMQYGTLVDADGNEK